MIQVKQETIRKSVRAGFLLKTVTLIFLLAIQNKPVQHQLFIKQDQLCHI